MIIYLMSFASSEFALNSERIYEIFDFHRWVEGEVKVGGEAAIDPGWNARQGAQQD